MTQVIHPGPKTLLLLLQVAFRKQCKSQRAEAEQQEDIRGKSRKHLLQKIWFSSTKSLIVGAVGDLLLSSVPHCHPTCWLRLLGAEMSDRRLEVDVAETETLQSQWFCFKLLFLKVKRLWFNVALTICVRGRKCFQDIFISPLHFWWKTRISR